MALQVQYISKDRPYSGEGARPILEGIDIISGGVHIYGTVMTPGGGPEERHPCAVMLHGYPGYTAMYDIAQALRRTGVVAVSIYYRGCWGSQGTYTLPGLVDDAAAAAAWAVSDDQVRAYGIDKDAVFFIGHSMGGFASINALRRLPWVRGAAVLAPYDFPALMEKGRTDEVKKLLADDVRVLRVPSAESLYEDAAYCSRAGFGLTKAFDDLKDRNLYLIGAAQDDIAPPDEMVMPLWERLSRHQTVAVQKCDMMDTDHGFNDARLTVSTMIAEWMQRVLADQ